MKLKLAIVQDCGPEGCRVMDLDGGEAYLAAYSTLVRDRIRIRQKQLAAVNERANPPEIVWRWFVSVVLEVKPEGLVVAWHGEYTTAAFVEGLAVEAHPGDRVWTCGVPEGFEVHDSAVKGQPAHPERLLAYIAPIIEAVYKPA